MSTTTITITEASIFWQDETPITGRWRYRVRRDDGTTESGPWDADINTRDGGLSDAVVALCYQHGIGGLQSGDVAIDGLCGTWTATEGTGR